MSGVEQLPGTEHCRQVPAVLYAKEMHLVWPCRQGPVTSPELVGASSLEVGQRIGRHHEGAGAVGPAGSDDVRRQPIEADKPPSPVGVREYLGRRVDLARLPAAAVAGRRENERARLCNARNGPAVLALATRVSECVCN